MAFDQTTRNRLQRFVNSAREILSDEFTRQLQAVYGMDPKQGTVADISSLTHLNNSQRQTAHILRETLEHYLATTPGKSDKDRVKQVLSRIVREQAFTVLNRLAALRMAEARDFLLESVGKGQSSKGFQLYRQLAGTSHGETGDAYRNYLFSLFDEFSIDLAVLFDRYSTQGRLFPRETALLELLAEINHNEIEALWAEDETIGWIYQFWNGRDEIDKMRSASRAPRNSREMAVRNQFFTPRYVVEFLTDNTLGRIWYEMTQGNTALIDSCSYLVRRPTEVFLKSAEQLPETDSVEGESLSQEELLKQPVYIPYRKLKDPRSIRMLDPACGSMHFGLYAFDLYEQIYLEAWQLEQELGPDAFQREANQHALQTSFANIDEFKAQIPKLIIENNIHGVDIDPRAVQIAGLSLWQRAQRAWQQQGVKPQQRPVIVKSNIVCAEPMPGDKDLLKEFTGKLHPPALGQLVEVIFDKMELAGEAGTLLKIEEEIQTAIDNARAQWETKKGSDSISDLFQDELEAATPQQELGFDLYGIDNETFWDDAEQLILKALNDYADRAEFDTDQKRLFAEDAAKGFAFIDLCRKRFDVVLMNPPFGEASSNSKKYIEHNYPHTKSNILASFVERGICIGSPQSRVGAITSRTCLYLPTMSGLREKVLGHTNEIALCADLGDGVLDAMVETSAYVIAPTQSTSLFYRLVTDSNKQELLKECCNINKSNKKVFISNAQNFRKLTDSPYCYWVDHKVIDKINLSTLEEAGATIKVGLQTGDDFRFLRNYWEVSPELVADSWVFYSKTEKAIPWHSPINLIVNWSSSGYEVKNFYDSKGKLRSRPQNIDAYFKPGFSYMNRSSRIVPYLVPKGCIPSAGRSQAFPYEGREIDALAICASNVGSAVARFRGENFGRPKFQVGMIQQLPFIQLSSELNNNLNNTITSAINSAKDYYATDETTLDFIGSPDLTIKYQPKTNFSTLLGHENELSLAHCYGLTAEEYEELQLDLQQAVSLRKVHEETEEAELGVQAATNHLSWLVGRAFGRWQEQVQSVRTNDIYAELPKQPPAFNFENPQNKLGRTGIADLDSLIQALDVIANPDLSEKCLALLGASDWKAYLGKSSKFFSTHYDQYSQNRRYTPIYWPLQTISGSYTLWIYYHRLNEQTLYTCINDFVEPKLAIVTADLNTLRNKSARSTEEEKELAQLTDLEAELKDFRDELLRLAKFWKPNLNDGVQITAAPLWKLFQHKAWQKKLKGTWEKLEDGEYDWAHLAGSIWPERVLRKCHQDRSLAIAHDVEDIFWHEVEIPIMRGKKPTGDTKTEWQPKNLTDTELTALIKQTVIGSK
ncbi:BREX-1 system adenine-specific DNA-methyltransferase PglX [Psychrobacter glacincola]|uniref:site-specific DNA-methyltransferase (adenine-specific) n=1 Tax=Psychrobacter glacincola TaxID=56810 RepID=A0ABW1W4X1_9GAMM|nr:BREX-1 system adenine-specific DNA-methyltransferase PglX [Psychrobacter glacincola]